MSGFGSDAWVKACKEYKRPDLEAEIVRLADALDEARATIEKIRTATRIGRSPYGARREVREALEEYDAKKGGEVKSASPVRWHDTTPPWESVGGEVKP